MPVIPDNINGVEIEFSSAVNKSVDQRVIDALDKVVKPGIAPGNLLNKKYIYIFLLQMINTHLQAGTFKAKEKRLIFQE